MSKLEVFTESKNCTGTMTSKPLKTFPFSCRKTSIAVVGSDSVENDETTSSEMVRSSSKKKSRVVYRSDSEDDGEE